MRKFDVREFVDNMDRRIWYASPDDCTNNNPMVYYRDYKPEFNPWSGDPKTRIKKEHRPKKNGLR